ncbi:MAG: DUF6033 family protein [Lachnospiraceae bacterium]|nr:DUF6033 family protein [Lachnospiraceae bacterium]
MAVGFDSNLYGVNPYKNAYDKQSAADRSKSPIPNAEENAMSSQVKNEAGVMYDKSSVLGSLVEQKTSGMLGKTVGQPELSETAKKYYDKLKAKFSDMDFILVSTEEKANAKANAASYANPNKMVVLIGEDEIEKMATDENFREKYEGLIAMAKEGIGAMKDQFGDSSEVKGYGMEIGEDGEVSYFAVLKKANEMQSERIQEKREENREARKAEEKKERAEALDELIENKRSARGEKAKEAYDEQEEFGYEVLSASSLDELFEKVSAYLNPAAAAEASYVGGNIDFSA